MDDELSDIFAFILSSDKVSAEDAKIIREFKADTDTGKHLSIRKNGRIANKIR